MEYFASNPLKSAASAHFSSLYFKLYIFFSSDEPEWYHNDLCVVAKNHSWKNFSIEAIAMHKYTCPDYTFKPFFWNVKYVSVMEVSDSFHCVWDSEVNLSLCNLMLKQIKITINSPYLIMVKVVREGMLSKEILEGTNTIVKKRLV